MLLKPSWFPRMAVVNPDHLLDQATRLTASSGKGTPRQADLRRAISTAYYAVFHEILAGAADSFAGRANRQTPNYALIYRSIEHKSLRAVCETLKRAKPPQKLPDRYSRYSPSGGFGEIVAVATAIAELNEKRQEADYDPLYRSSLSDALAAIATARDALALLRSANRTRRAAFFSLIVFPPR